MFLFLDPIDVHVLYAPVPVCLLFHQPCSPLQHPEITEEARGKAKLMFSVLWICYLGGVWNGLMVVAERRGLSQLLGTSGEKGEMCFFLVMSD